MKFPRFLNMPNTFSPLVWLGILLISTLASPLVSEAQSPSSFNWFFQNCHPAPPQWDGNPKGRPTLCQQYGSVPIDITIPVVPTPPNGGSITFASSVNWGAVNGFVQNKNIALTNGDLIMDIPLTFLNCKFVMSGDVVIRTTDDNPFTAYFTKFFCCANMWKGIEAKGNSTVALWWCELEDARRTLQIDDVVQGVYLAGNTFNRNHVNISNGTTSPGNGTLNFPFFFDNTFECTSKTVHGNGINNTGEQWTKYHVHLDHCATSLGHINAVTNHFFDTHYPTSIYLEDADLTILGAEFKRFGTVASSDQYGHAIYTEWGPSYAGSHITARNCTFESQAQSAIFAQRSDVDIDGCTFNGRLLRGLESYENHASELIKVKNSTFNILTGHEVNAIWAERPIASSGKHVDITGNHFNQIDNEDHSFYGYRGVYIESEFNIHVADQTDISDNHFLFNIPDAAGNPSGLVEAAIYVNTPAAFDNTRIIGNTVDVNKAFLQFGILLSDQLGAGLEVSHNTVNGKRFLLDASFDNTAIDILNATSGVTMCDNTVDEMTLGIRLRGNNGQSDFSSNNFGKHDVGLSIADAFTQNGTPITGTIGTQSGRGNTWLTAAGSYVDKAGQCENSASSSRFFIEQQFAPGTSHFPATILLAPSSGWFVNQNINSDWCAPMAAPPGMPRLSIYDQEVAGGTGVFASLSAVSQWEARRLLIDKVLRYPSIISGNAATTGFYSTWFNSSPGKFAQVENQIRSAYAIETADQSSMDNIESQRSSIQLQLISLQNGQTLPQTPTTNPSLMAATEVLLAQLRPLHQQEVALKAQISQKQVTKLQNVLTANALLPSSTLQEQNRRMFNQLSITLFLNGTLNATQEAQLLALTASGQTNGGLAVEEAKILLPKCGPNAAPRTSKVPDRSDNGISGKQISTLQGQMSLQPNPVSDLLSVYFDPELSGSIVLMDLAGKAWVEEVKKAGVEQLTIRTEEIPSGVYFLSFRSNAGKNLVQKVIIQH